MSSGHAHAGGFASASGRHLQCEPPGFTEPAKVV